MKRTCLLLVLLLSMLFPPYVFANMAEPKQSDIASTITFEKNEALTVLAEHLEIRVNGDTAQITAVYQMKNTTDEPVSTETMFLSPSIEAGEVSVLVDGEEAEWETERHILNYFAEVQTDDWQYVVLMEDAYKDEGNGRTVDSIRFALDFDAREEREIVVSYTYHLGGYPTHTRGNRDGTIEYFLRPAAMWKDFKGLTIDLYLDRDMPNIRSSSLPFARSTGERHWQYSSDTLPDEDLYIMVVQDGYQSLLSRLQSPNFGYRLLTSAPLWLPALLFIAAMVVGTYKIKHEKDE